jgi:hypothetical protein
MAEGYPLNQYCSLNSNVQSVKRVLLLLFIVIILSPINLYGQIPEGRSSFIKSLQGTWAYTEPGAGLWLKVVIKGHRLTGYAAYPGSGKFVAESEYRIREVTLVYKSNIRRDNKSETFAQIRKPTLTNDRIYLRYEGEQPYIVFSGKDSQKLKKVASDFDPWIQVRNGGR